MWKHDMENMGLWVNMAKTNVLKCQAESVSSVSSGNGLVASARKVWVVT